MTKRKPCRYCGSTHHTEEEHIRARSKGGKKTVNACRACNRSKSDKQLMQWLRDIKESDPYRWRRIREYNRGKKNPIAKKVQKVRDE
jgi:hypothetical protein